MVKRDEDNQWCRRGFRALVVALTHLRYNDAEVSGDEAVLQRLLDVLLLALRSPLARTALGDKDICLVVETMFSLCALPRSSELFRKQAELACLELGGIIFDCLSSKDFKPDAEVPTSPTSLKIGYPGTRADEPAPLPPALAALEAEIEKVEAQQLRQQQQLHSKSSLSPASRPSPVPSVVISSINGPSRPTITPIFPIEDVEVCLPFGMPAVMAFLEHLLWLLEISETRNTDRLRCLCLVLVGDLLEAHGTHLPEVPTVWRFVSTRLAKVLLQLLGQESPLLAPYLHQCLLGLFSRHRALLVAQFEMFLSSLLGLLNAKISTGGSGGGTKGPKISKEYYLELLLHFCLDPAFLRDLYVYYECDAHFGYILSDLISSLAATALLDPRQASAAGGGQDHSYLLALEIILTILRTFASTLGPIDTHYEGTINPDRLRQERQKKRLIVQSASLFNQKPQDAFDFLLEHHLIHKVDDSKELAQYLRRTPGLDKRTVGELISKPTNIDLLKDYLADFHFAGLEIDEALRSVLESFRLPGESQQISRIMEVFAQIYYRDANQRGVFCNEDAVFVLAYSIVMLNTDQHNRQVRHRMSLDEFIRNNRGINDGRDFEPSFLRKIYEAIRNQEIVMPEEQGTEAAFNFAWNEALKKKPNLVSKQEIPPVEVVAVDLLTVAWKPIINCLRTLILSPRTDTTSKAAIRGLGELGGVIDHFLGPSEMEDLLSVLVEALAFSEIANNPAGNQLPRYLARSELFRALIRCFFDQFRLYANKMRERTWGAFVEHILMLVEATVVTLATFEVEASLGYEADDDRKRSSSGDNTAVNVKSESGIFSTISSYWSAGSGGSNANAISEAKGIDAESRAKAIEFLRTCKLPDILCESRLLEGDSIVALMTALLSELRAEFHKSGGSSPGVATSQPPPPSLSAQLQSPCHSNANWETETLVFLADLMIHTAWYNRDRLSLFWNPLYERFSLIAKDLAAPALLREHCILGIGRLSLRFAEQPNGSQQQWEVVQFFQLLCYLPPETFQHIAESALALVVRIVELDPPLLHGTAIWPHYFSVLALAGRSKSCGPYSFGLLTTIVREKEGILFPLDFYSEYVDLLNGFVASIINSNVKSSSGTVELAIQALHKFPLLEAHVRQHSARPSLIAQLWAEYIIPVHCAIAQQCYHPVREVRNMALSLLQKTLLSTDFYSTPLVQDEFRLVLLPLLEELQRPEMRNLDGNGLAEIQIRATAVISKAFLANLNFLFPSNKSNNGSSVEEKFGAWVTGTDLWLEILTSILRFLQLPSMGKASDQLLGESIPETIKNMLLVMASSLILQPPSSTSFSPSENEEGFAKARQRLWNETWNRLDSLLPGAKSEITQLSQQVPSLVPKNKPTDNTKISAASQISNGLPDLTKPTVNASNSAITTSPTMIENNLEAKPTNLETSYLPPEPSTTLQLPPRLDINGDAKKLSSTLETPERHPTSPPGLLHNLVSMLTEVEDFTSSTDAELSSIAELPLPPNSNSLHIDMGGSSEMPTESPLTPSTSSVQGTTDV